MHQGKEYRPFASGVQFVACLLLQLAIVLGLLSALFCRMVTYLSIGAMHQLREDDLGLLWFSECFSCLTTWP